MKWRCLKPRFEDCEYLQQTVVRLCYSGNESQLWTETCRHATSRQDLLLFAVNSFHKATQYVLPVETHFGCCQISTSMLLSSVTQRIHRWSQLLVANVVLMMTEYLQNRWANANLQHLQHQHTATDMISMYVTRNRIPIQSKWIWFVICDLIILYIIEELSV